jgi:hydrogenase nickel incorporation protein HypA/HybF
MHELSIAQGLVEVACEALARCEPSPAAVQSVLVRIGVLSGVVADALEFCYELSVQGTPLESSRLVVEEQPAVVFCPNCLENRVLKDVCVFRCPACGTPTSRLIHGRELELVSLELVDHDEPTHEPSSDSAGDSSSTDSRGAAGLAQGQ